MQNYKQDLLPNETFHVFSRAVGEEKLFKNNQNYFHFLEKMKKYILPIADILTYTLLPNHFHLILRIKNKEDLKVIFEKAKRREINNEDNMANFVSTQIGHLLNSYTKYYNKINNRKGALFIDGFKRSIVNYDADFSAFIFYVHKNAVHHGYTNKIGLWKFDGYNALISKEPTLLLRDLVINWFGDIEDFIKFHNQKIEIKNPPFDV